MLFQHTSNIKIKAIKYFIIEVDYIIKLECRTIEMDNVSHFQDYRNIVGMLDMGKMGVFYYQVKIETV